MTTPEQRFDALLTAMATIILHGKEATVIERDTKYANAWFLAIDGARLPHSISRDMVKVV